MSFYRRQKIIQYNVTADSYSTVHMQIVSAYIKFHQVPVQLVTKDWLTGTKIMLFP